MVKHLLKYKATRLRRRVTVGRSKLRQVDHPGPARPIACSLTAADLRDREAAWRTLLTTSLVSRDTVPGGIRLAVHPGSVPSLLELVDLERECCPWIDFVVQDASLTITAEGDGEAAIRSMFV